MVKARVRRYAKTLFKPERPEYADKLIKKYTKAKVPYFFIYAKDKKKQNCEPKGTNIIDLITTAVKENRQTFRMVKNLAPVDYHLMLRNPKMEYTNEAVNKVFDHHNRHYFYNIQVDEANRDKTNMYAISTEVMNSLLQIEPDPEKVACSIIKFLYEKPSSRRKNLFWFIFGEYVYNNLVKNTDVLPQNICMKCGKRTDEDLVFGKCEVCRKIEIKKNKGFVETTCVDCGDIIRIRGNWDRRCPTCLKAFRKRKDAEVKRIIRSCDETQ